MVPTDLGSSYLNKSDRFFKYFNLLKKKRKRNWSKFLPTGVWIEEAAEVGWLLVASAIPMPLAAEDKRDPLRTAKETKNLVVVYRSK